MEEGNPQESLRRMLEILSAFLIYTLMCSPYIIRTHLPIASRKPNIPNSSVLPLQGPPLGLAK